jgi:hypothetical protein
VVLKRLICSVNWSTVRRSPRTPPGASEFLGRGLGVDQRAFDPVGVLAAEEVADFPHDEQGLADQFRRFLRQGLKRGASRR